jgi:hypothetical protein
MVALNKLKNIGEQSCWKDHNGTVTLPGRQASPLLLVFQAFKEAWRKPLTPDMDFLHLFI